MNRVSTLCCAAGICCQQWQGMRAGQDKRQFASFAGFPLLLCVYVWCGQCNGLRYPWRAALRCSYRLRAAVVRYVHILHIIAAAREE